MICIEGPQSTMIVMNVVATDNLVFYSLRSFLTIVLIKSTQL
jgi:hypothetical protein